MNKRYRIVTILAVLLFWYAFIHGNTASAEKWSDEHSGDYTNSGTIKPNGTKDLEVPNGKLTNTGDITITADGTVSSQELDNSGTITNQGTLSVENSEEEEGQNQKTAHNSGDITNKGTGAVTVDGNLSNDNTGTLTNTGNKGATVDVYGDLSNSGSIDNSAKESCFSVGGNLNNTDGQVSNSNSDFSVDLSVNNKATDGHDSSIQNSGTGNFTVGENFTNDGGSVSNEGSYKNEEFTSSFGISGQLENTNGGSIDNTSSEFSVEGAIKNGENSSITNSGGNFNATGTGYFMVENEDGELEEPEEGYSFENAGSITNENGLDAKGKNTVQGNMTVDGTFKNDKTGEVENTGGVMTFGDSAENEGSITNSNDTNTKGKTVQGTLNFGADLKNKGQINNGDESDDKRALFNVAGDLVNEGADADIENSGKITVEGDIKNVNGGKITNQSNGRINSADQNSNLYNAGEVDNSGNITLNDFFNGYDGVDYDVEDEDGNPIEPPKQNGKFHNEEGGKLVVNGKFNNGDTDTLEVDSTAEFENDGTLVYGDDIHNGSGANSNAKFKNGENGKIITFEPETPEDGEDPEEPDNTFYGSIYNGEGQDSTALFENEGEITLEGDIYNYGNTDGAKGGTFTNAADAKLNVTGDIYSSGTFNNVGETTVTGDFNNVYEDNTEDANDKGGTLTNKGKLKIEGDLDNSDQKGSVTNEQNGTIEVGGNVTSDGKIDNSGTFTVTGTLDNEENGEITNSGTFDVKDDITNNGDIKNTKDFTAEGNMTNAGSVESSGKFTVKGDVTTNNGSITNKDKGTFSVEGALNNTGKDSSITNDGTFTVGDDMTNDGTIESSGSFTVTGDVTTNNGSITNKDNSTFSVGGELNNTGKDSSITNNGTFSVGDDMTNDGTIDSTGSFTVKGDITTNNGSITNENNSTFSVEGALSNTSADSSITNNGTFTAGGDITNNGSISNALDAEFTTSENGTFNNNKSLTNEGTFNLNSKLSSSGSDSTITNSGTFNLKSDASGYKGSYSQSTGQTTVNEGSKYFDGKSDYTGGVLNWNIDDEASNLNMSGNSTSLNINGENSKLTLNGGTIAGEVDKKIEGTLSIQQGDVTLKENTQWKGAVELKDGTLTLDGAVQNGKFSAEKGNLNIKKDFAFENFGEDVTEVKQDVKVTLDEGVNAQLNGAKMHLSDGDTWKGTVTLGTDSKGRKAELDIEGKFAEDDGNIVAHTGKVDFKANSEFTLNKNSEISENAEVDVESGSKLTIKDGGSLTLDDGDEAAGLPADQWHGDVKLQKGGTLKYGFKDATDGTLEAEAGDLYLLKDSNLALQGDISSIQDEVNLHILKGSSVEIKDGATLNLDGEDVEGDGKDEWFGNVKVEEGGTLKTKKVTTPDGGTLQQEGGNSIFEDSDIYINGDDSYITGGKVTLNNSTLRFGNGSFNAADLNLSDGSTFSIRDKSIDSAYSSSVEVGEVSNFEIDIHGRHRKSDVFNFDNLTASGEHGTVHVSDFNFLGGAPIDREIKFQIFKSVTLDDNIDFTANGRLVNTPIGRYGLKSLGGGMYSLYLHDYNPQIFRGQVSTIAMYANQLQIDDIVTNHFILHDETMLDKAQNANKYSAASPLFTPYQKTYEDGGLWSKSYASFERFNLTHGLDVGNNAYGTLAGADLPAIDLNNDWKFIPTGYIGYNGAHQYFNGVSSYQNGAQLGVMGTFIYDEDLITSVTAYGGGYLNEMDVQGFTDETGNWFAGTAVKTAYNWHVLKDFILQPNLFVAYNAFGEQNWGTDYGIMSMKTGMMNGVNLAPGLNMILSKDSWSLYTNLQYMYFINDKVNGQAGNVTLPNVRMEHGYIQYGVGATKVFKDSVATYAQVNMRNGGITGVGFQLGFQWLFDFGNKLHLKKAKAKTQQNPQEISDTYIKKVYIKPKNTVKT